MRILQLVKHRRGGRSIDTQPRPRGKRVSALVEALCAGATLAIVPAAVAPAATGPRLTGMTAGTVTVAESAHMRPTSHRGTQVLNETGTGTGTFHCPIDVQLDVGSSGASISFSIVCSSRDSISGSGHASYYVSGTNAHFTGNISASHGTGRYAHVSAAGLRVTGSLARSSYAMSFSVTGRMRT